jgi:hypothetical protein
MMPQRTETGTGDATSGTGAEPFDRRVIVAGGVVFAVLMALSGRYGFHRDELYFLDCARHLQASYVDQPGCGCGRRWRPGPRSWSAG